MEVIELPHDGLAMDFERFRVINPRSEARMIQSIRTYGQISPVVAGRFTQPQTAWVLIDGFKRYRATRILKQPHLRVCCVEGSMQAFKAMVLTVNRDESPCREFEEALVLHSLHREDGLEQREIAVLCGRHKSWVCRRIGLVERLCDEIREQLRLGLVSTSIARELLRLPRGNQEALLTALRRDRLTTRQSTELVDAFLRKPAWQREQLLRDPDQMTNGLLHPRVDCGVFSTVVMNLERHSQTVAQRIAAQGVGMLNQSQCAALDTALERVIKRCRGAVELVTAHNHGGPNGRGDHP